MRKEDVGVDEIAAIILSRLGVDPYREQEQGDFLRRELSGDDLMTGILFDQDKSVSTEVRRWAAELVARRLKANQREQPLISADDWSELKSEVGGAIKETLEKPSADLSKFLVGVANIMIASIVSRFGGIVRSSDNLYGEYWRLVEIVCTLAAERGLPITEFLNLEGSHDEITRQVFTREEYLSRCGEDVSAEPPKEFSIPANELSSVLSVGEFDLSGVTVEITPDFPALREALRKWDLLEADRIYGPDS